MGVWIETGELFNHVSPLKVTPFVGVWIETGLTKQIGISNPVTPFVGVWIETLGGSNMPENVKSHPSWVCGLKHNLNLNKVNHSASHPSWVCGLKL